MMRTVAAALALAALLLGSWGCAEGGSRGSGISSGIFGNVSEASGGGSVQSIRVSIENTRYYDYTNATGAFSIRGNYEGAVGVVFALPSGGAARVAVNVPADGQLTLVNVTVDTETGEARAESQAVNFTGDIVGVDCGGATLTMVSTRASDDDEYVVRLDTSTISDRHGTAIPCSAVKPGDTATVQGTVNADGTFGEATVVLGN